MNNIPTADVKEQFPLVFSGLGNLGEEYEIQQYHIHCTCLGMYHYPYDPKCTIEWKHFVISKVDKPTPWCAGMVTVPKKVVAICICVTKV